MIWLIIIGGQQIKRVLLVAYSLDLRLPQIINDCVHWFSGIFAPTNDRVRSLYAELTYWFDDPYKHPANLCGKVVLSRNFTVPWFQILVPHIESFRPISIQNLCIRLVSYSSKNIILGIKIKLNCYYFDNLHQ